MYLFRGVGDVGGFGGAKGEGEGGGLSQWVYASLTVKVWRFWAFAS